MTKLDAGLITPLPASDSGTAAVWGSKRINLRPRSCLCLTWSGCPSNDNLNIVRAYPSQVDYSMKEKNDFWEDLDGLIESVSKEERIVLGADLNGHVGEGNIGDE